MFPVERDRTQVLRRLNGGGLAANDYYNGQIAELMVYNGQLSKTDVNLVAD